MSKKSPTPFEVKLLTVQQCLAHVSNPYRKAKELGISKQTVQDWMRKYEIAGLEGIKESLTRTTYSNEVKLAAMRDVLSKQYSVEETIKKYHISSRAVLQNWISKYTKEIEQLPTGKERGLSPMNKGRNTTFVERLEIVEYTIANGLDYQKAIDKYKVSYKQIYSWVKKYQTRGEEALKDNRGRNKPVEELSEQEQLKLRIKELEARNQYLEMEIAFEKKLKEIRKRNTRSR